MKQSLKTFLPAGLLILLPLLFCLILSFLYTYDLLSSHFYQLLCFLIGALFYLSAGILFSKIIKKRQFIIALLLTCFLFAFEIYSGVSSSWLPSLIKLFLFDASVLMMHLKSS